MPRRDGTGPEGMGTMTGRGLGNCTGGNAEYTGQNYRQGLGLRRGRGLGMGLGAKCRNFFGMGYGNGRFNNITKISEEEYLKKEKENIENELANIRKRLDDLSTEK